jgi:RNase P subunit RPR2
MKTSLNKTQVHERIEHFFKNNEFKPEQLKKIKRLAMKLNIKLKPYKKLFCKKCLNPLKGKTRITKTHKTIICKNCQHKNKWRIKND